MIIAAANQDGREIVVITDHDPMATRRMSQHVAPIETHFLQLPFYNQTQKLESLLAQGLILESQP